MASGQHRRRGRGTELDLPGGGGRPGLWKGPAKVSTVETPELLRNAGLRRLFDYWTQLRGPRFAPARAELRPSEIPRALPHILLLDRLAGGDFRIRLMGTHIVNGLGADLTGRALSALPGADHNLLAQLACGVADSAAPVIYGRTETVIAGQPVSVIEALGLPLSEQGRSVDMVLTGLSLALRTNVGPLAIGALRR